MQNGYLCGLATAGVAANDCDRIIINGLEYLPLVVEHWQLLPLSDAFLQGGIALQLLLVTPLEIFAQIIQSDLKNKS